MRCVGKLNLDGGGWLRDKDFLSFQSLYPTEGGFLHFFDC